MKRIFCVISLLVVLILFYNCSNSKESRIKTLRFLKIETRDITLDSSKIISSRNVPYDSIAKIITLPKLDEYQKEKITLRLSYFDSSSAIRAHNAYLLSIQERAPNVITLAVYTQSNYGNILFLVNFNDTTLISYLDCGEDNVGDAIRETRDREVIEGVNRWFEFRGSSVYKIEKRLIRFEFFDKRPNLEFLKDSVITKYKIDKNGRFNFVSHDSTAFKIPNLP